MSKPNCWEYKKCGRETGGRKVKELGVCPTAQENRLDGIHGGLNAGRACWVVAGSLCDGKRQGTFAQKFDSCSSCDFYREVRANEQAGFLLSATLLKRIREPQKTA